MNYRSFLAALAVVLAASSACAFELDLREINKVRMTVKEDGLNRGTSSFVVRAVEAPALGDPSVDIGTKTRQFHEMLAVGISAGVIDVGGVSPDGTTIDPVWVEAFHEVMDMVRQARGTLVVRIPGAEFDGTPIEVRREVIKTVANAVRPHREALYWINGPDAEPLTSLFRHRAAFLTTLSEEGGHITVVDEPPSEWVGKNLFVNGAMPLVPDSDVHFGLPGTPEDFARIDQAMALPVENLPWTPDQSQLSDAERAEGFISLFDGKSLAGWGITGRNPRGFIVKDGAIEWNQRGGGTLRTRDRYDNFVLRLEWRIAAGGNSGIHIHVPRVGRSSKIGFEVQMLGDYGAPPNKNGTGAIYDVIAPTENASKPAWEWNDLEVTCDGPHVKVVLNGVTVQDINFDDHDALRYRLRNGFFALTDHGHPVSFRNIRIKPL